MAARDLLENAYSKCPEDYETGLELARVCLSLGDSTCAESVLKKLVLQRDTPELHTLLGEVYAAKKDSKRSAAEYQIAAQRDPSEQHVFDFGTALLKVDFKAAATVLAYGVKSFPRSVKMEVALGLALYAQDEAEEGAAHLLHAADLDPNDPHPMEVLAGTQVVPRSVLPQAVQRLDELHRRHPEDALLLFDDAMVRSERWSGDGAALPSTLVGDLQQCLKLDPHFAKAYFALSLIYDQTADYQREIEALRHAIDIEPNNPHSHYRLAFAYRHAGNEPGFKQELQRYQVLHAQQPEAQR